MFLFLPFAIGIPRSGTVSPIDQYLLGSDDPLEIGSRPTETSFSMVPGEVFSQRLATILNTVWQASLASGSTFLEISTTFTGTREISVYAADYLFVGLLLMISLILQLCAIAGLILKYTATAPDVFGYISTMTTDNQHTKVPPGGNTLDGLKRARYLYSMKVQLADVKKGRAHGHLAFRSVDNDAEFAAGKLSKKRLYV